MNNKYNTLLKCIHSYPAIDTHNFEEGKIYEVKDGKLIDGNGKQSHSTYDCIEDINDSFYARFKEV